MKTRSATQAASRYGGRSGRRLSHALAALEMRDDAGEKVTDLLGREMAIKEAMARDRNRRCLLRHDEHGRVGLFREPQGGAMARAERLVGDFELRERQHAAR